MAHILIVEEMKGVRKALAALLRDDGYEVTEAETANLAIELLRQKRFALVLTAVLMTDLDGTEVIHYIETMPDKPKVVAMCSGNDQIPAEMALLMTKPQAHATLKKPVNEQELLATLRTLLG